MMDFTDLVVRFWIPMVFLAVLAFVFTFTPLGKALTRGGPWPALSEKPDPIGEGLGVLFWVVLFLLVSFLFWYSRS